MSRQSLENILMKRDRITRDMAKAEIQECLEELETGNYEAIQDVLGLEDNYIFDVMGW